MIGAGLLLGNGANAADVGDAIDAAGGSQFSINAGNAIQVTCVALNNAPTALSLAEEDLRGRCVDMVNTARNLLNSDSFPNAENRFGLSSNDELFATLRQFSGEEASTQGRYATEGTNNQFGAIANRLSAIRQGARSSSLAFNMYGIDLAQANQANTARSPGDYRISGGAAGDADTGIAWFGTLSYGFGDRDSSDNEDEYDADSFGATVGLDYAFANGLVIGGAFGYNSYEIDFDEQSLSAVVDPVSGGGLEIDSYTVSGYLDYHSGTTYVSGIVSYGASDYDMERFVTVSATPTASAQNRSIVSDTDADQFSAQVQVGRSFGSTAVTFDVYAGFEVSSIEIDAFVETDTSSAGSLGLAFDDQDIDSAQALIGGTLRKAINIGGGVLVPYATLEYRHEFDNDSRAVSARYAFAVGTGAGLDFLLPTDKPDEDFFEISAGVAGQLGNNIALFLQYSGVIGLKDTSANLITLGMRGIF
jgi:uncharacterized protein with beta-barrel porin domain